MITLNNKKRREVAGVICIIIASILLYVDVGNSNLVNIGVIFISIMLMVAFYILVIKQLPKQHTSKILLATILIAILLAIILFTLRKHY